MHPLALASWLLLPIAPINPVVHDTLSPITIQASIGIWGPSNLLSAGPELAVRSEFLLSHPLSFRAGVELRQYQAEDFASPRGDVASATVVGELAVYRGTHKLMGFLGVGAGYTFFSFEPDARTRDSLSRNESIDDIALEHAVLFRAFLGLRFRQRYAVEIKFSDTRGRFTTARSASGTMLFETEDKGTAAGAVSLTVGYVFDL